jgi:hypothetical protein
VILERLAGGDAGFLLAEAPELQRIVFERGTDIVGDQVVMGDQMALVGVIPEPAGIFNQFPVMINQRVINRDYTVWRIVGGRVTLQQFKAPPVECLFIPVNLSDPAVQARLVGRGGKLAVDPADGFAFRNKQASQILGEVPTLWVVRKQIRVLNQEILHDAGKFDNRGHTASAGSFLVVRHVPHRTTG